MRLIQQSTSNIHVTTVFLMYGSRSGCRQKQSSDGRRCRSVASKLPRTRSSVSRVRQSSARRHDRRPASSTSSSSCVSSSSRHNSDRSTSTPPALDAISLYRPRTLLAVSPQRRVTTDDPLKANSVFSTNHYNYS